ncbi:MAG: hypothetical protein HUK40_22960 [Desulfobacter sp.]|nr:hypothetical protein [Desulfobacter sp.]WDP86115.1 MAG: hypothetical protein HUN05_14075 [Desulfobacter sp.]
MVKKMTILDAVDAFELYDCFNEMLEPLEIDFYTHSQMETDLRDLIEEHDDTYEFTPDENGSYAQSLERNLKEALTFIFEAHGVEHLFEDDFLDEAMDDDEIEGIYDDGLEVHYMDETDDENELSEDDPLF